MRTLGTIALLAIIVGVFCYANGWLTLQKNSATTTIELKTGQMRDAADRAIEQGKDAIENATKQQPVTTDAAPEEPVVAPLPPQPIPAPAPVPTTPSQPEELYETQVRP